MIIKSMEKEEISSMAPSKVGKMIRISVHTFLKEYQYFTSIAAILALPFSLSLLLSQSLFLIIPPTILVSSFRSSFNGGGLFSIVGLKLSQSFSSAIVTLPFALSFLLFAKATAIRHFKGSITPKFSRNRGPGEKPLWRVYRSLLPTHLWNSLLIFSISAVFLTFSFLVEVGTTTPMYGLAISAMGAVVYSVALANATVVSTLALAHAGLEGTGGLRAVLSTYNIIKSNKNNTWTALALAVPTNLGLAAIEALFRFRIISFPQENHDYYGNENSSKELWLLALEAVFIAYLYSIIIVLDVIISCFFYLSCCDHKVDEDYSAIHEDDDHEDYYYNLDKLKGLEENSV